jgi:hypothetical protein
LSTGIQLDIGERLREAAPRLSSGIQLRIRGRLDTRTDPPAIRVTHWAQVQVLG